MMKNILKEIKMGFHSLRYGFQVKTNLVLAILFLVLGFICEIFTSGENIFGGLYMMICGIIPMQLICSVGVSDLAKTSPKRKHLETFIPSACTTIIMLAIYTILVIIKMVSCHLNPESVDINSMYILELAILACLLLVYSGFVYKYFVVSIIILFACMGFFGAMVGSNLMERGELMLLSIPFGVSAACGYVIIFAGGFLCWLLTTLFYKKEMSKHAFGAALRKAMQ